MSPTQHAQMMEQLLQQPSQQHLPQQQPQPSKLDRTYSHRSTATPRPTASTPYSTHYALKRKTMQTKVLPPTPPTILPPSGGGGGVGLQKEVPVELDEGELQHQATKDPTQEA